MSPGKRVALGAFLTALIIFLGLLLLDYLLEKSCSGQQSLQQQLLHLQQQIQSHQQQQPVPYYSSTGTQASSTTGTMSSTVGQTTGQTTGSGDVTVVPLGLPYTSQASTTTHSSSTTSDQMHPSSVSSPTYNNDIHINSQPTQSYTSASSSSSSYTTSSYSTQPKSVTTTTSITTASSGPSSLIADQGLASQSSGAASGAAYNGNSAYSPYAAAQAAPPPSSYSAAAPSPYPTTASSPYPAASPPPFTPAQAPYAAMGTPLGLGLGVGVSQGVIVNTPPPGPQASLPVIVSYLLAHPYYPDFNRTPFSYEEIAILQPALTPLWRRDGRRNVFVFPKNLLPGLRTTWVIFYSVELGAWTLRQDIDYTSLNPSPALVATATPGTGLLPTKAATATDCTDYDTSVSCRLARQAQRLGLSNTVATARFPVQQQPQQPQQRFSSLSRRK